MLLHLHGESSSKHFLPIFYTSFLNRALIFSLVKQNDWAEDDWINYVWMTWRFLKYFIFWRRAPLWIYECFKTRNIYREGSFRIVSKLMFKLYQFCSFPLKLLKDDGLQGQYLMVSGIFKLKLVGICGPDYLLCLCLFIPLPSSLSYSPFPSLSHIQKTTRWKSTHTVPYKSRS